MKSVIFLASCLAAHAASAFAQSSAQMTDRQSPDTAESAAEAQDPQKTSQPKTNSHGNAPGGGKTRMVGCILGQDGKYILVTRKQSSVVKLNSAQDLKSYVGHKVKVTGSNDPAAIQNEASRPSASSNGTLIVTKLQVISNKCDVDSGKDSEKSWKRILTP